MTGFIGERTNRPVALVTDDFRVYHELARFFEEHGITIVGVRPGEALPAAAQVIIDGPDDDARSLARIEDQEAMWLAVLAKLDPRRDGPYRRVVVGVDPGETIGLAVLADGTVFWVSEVRAPVDVAERVRTWHPALAARGWHVHVGDGAPDVGGQIVDACKEVPDVHVHVVHEGSSTPTAPLTRSRHTDAAILIAMREEA